MRREPSGVDSDLDADFRESRRMKDALHVLLEAREMLLAQMTEDILSHREGLLHASGSDGAFSFELQEIEDRYSARLSALNALLENLEYRQPRIRHRVEEIATTVDRIADELEALLARDETWDLVDFEIVEREGDQVLVIVALARDDME